MTLSFVAATAAVLLFTAAMVVAGFMDLTTMKIRNALVLLLLLAYPVLGPLAGLGLSEMALSAGAGAAVLTVGITFFAFGWMGGGDVKLAAVTALWLGVDHLLAYFIYTALFGGVLTLILLQLRLMPLPAGLQARPWIARLQSVENGVPYGVAMAAAALFVFPGTTWLAGL